MFKLFSRKKKDDEPLAYKLVRDLRCNGAPMRAEVLISWYVLKYDEAVVRRELQKMAEEGIVIGETLHYYDGFSEGWIEYVRLPEQTSKQLAFAS